MRRKLILSLAGDEPEYLYRKPKARKFVRRNFTIYDEKNYVN